MTSVGVLELASKYRYGLTSRGHPLYLFKPYDPALPDMIVGCKERDTTRNQIACVTLPLSLPLSLPLTSKPRANLVRLYGYVGDKAAEEAALLDYYCPTVATAATATATAATATATAATAESNDRIRLSSDTGWITFHIDPPGCRDIDDVIAWSPTEKIWAITIADVDAAIGHDEVMMQSAQKIAQTFYTLEGKAIRPMLPSAISEDAASLRSDGKFRPGVTLFCHDLNAPAEDRWALTMIRVDHSYTYDTFRPELVGLTVDSDPHDWIAQFMIRYNTAAAKLLKSHNVGLLRCQSPAESAAVEAWKSIHPDLVHMANEAATYEPVSATEDQGHAGLGIAAYCHASSPLRRFADLYNQAILKQIIQKKPVIKETTAIGTLAEHLNQRCKAERAWARDLTFLHHVSPGSVLSVDVVIFPLSQSLTPQKQSQAWVPAWKRIIRLRHVPDRTGATTIQVFCDPTCRNWKQRILTAALCG